MSVTSAHSSTIADVGFSASDIVGEENYNDIKNTTMQKWPLNPEEDDAETGNREDLDSADESQKPKSLKKFAVSWLEDDRFKGWLQPVPGNYHKSRCAACDKIINAGKSEILKHAKGLKHNSRLKNFKPEPLSIPIEELIAPRRSINRKKRQSAGDSPKKGEKRLKLSRVKEAEVRLAGFLGEYNLDYGAVNHLVPMLQKSFPFSRLVKQIQLNPSKCEELLCQVASKQATESLISVLRKIQFSVIIDLCKDACSAKYLSILVHYITEEEEKVTTEFLKLIPADVNCTANDLFLLFKNYFVCKKIPFSNIIGIAADGSDVLVGNEHSFFSNVRMESSNITLMQCNCYTYAIVASKATEMLPNEIEDLLHCIATFVPTNDKSFLKLYDIQKYLQNGREKMLQFTAVRWLALHNCVANALENWDFINDYFRKAVYEDDIKSAIYVLNLLNSPCAKGYLLFLNYALSYFDSLQALFQSHKILIHVYAQDSIKLFNMICQNFLNSNALSDCTVDVRNSENHLNVQNVYLGTECEQYIAQLDPTQVQEFRLKCLDFYIVAALEIQKRLPLNDPVFSEIKFLKPSITLRAEARDNSCELKYIGQKFRRFIDINALSVEWRSLPHFYGPKQKKHLMTVEIDDMWSEIASAQDCQNDLQFPNLGKLAHLTLALPFPSGAVERILATIRELHSQQNKLSDKALNAICFIHCNYKCKGIHFKSNFVNPSVLNNDSDEFDFDI